ncbi:MAG: SGNH/GDSL hydrolase family protein [Bryobacteraceae bacterium]|jgi:lysophospholipase L1-like esterase
MKLRLTTLFLSSLACAAAQEHWVATWATAQLMARLPAPAPAANAMQPPVTPPPGSRFNNQTVRMIARASIGGRRVRIKLQNAFGNAPVMIGAAHIAVRANDSAIVPGSDRALSFDGAPGCMIGPGVVLLSDPVDFTFAPLADLAVSLYIPGETGPPTNHATALHTTFIQSGDATSAEAMPDAAHTQAYYWLAGIDVVAPPAAAAIVTFGDSITDGARSSNESNHSWPALLAARLAADKATANIGVANMGIGGNRVLRDVSGVSALGRFDRDVLSQSGVKWVMLLEGINDIGHGTTAPAEAVTAENLIGSYKQLIERAHTQGVLTIGCTLTPYEGANYYREDFEKVREDVNAWIRTPGNFDAFVDFEAAVRDPADPKKFRAEFDPGDHLHPNDKGYEAMANAIDLVLFSGKKAKR